MLFWLRCLLEDFDIRRLHLGASHHNVGLTSYKRNILKYVVKTQSNKSTPPLRRLKMLAIGESLVRPVEFIGRCSDFSASNS